MMNPNDGNGIQAQGDADGGLQTVGTERMVGSKKRSAYIPSSDNFHYEDFPFYWVSRAHNLYIHHLETALKKIGTDIPTWRVLCILMEQGTSSMSEISTHAIVKLSTMTRIVYRMKAEGLVDTRSHPDDGRVTEVTMTEVGSELAHRIQKVTCKLATQSFRGLSDAQLGRLNAALKQMFDNLAED